jgi:hypothetical protein
VASKFSFETSETAVARCVCGAVAVEIIVPAIWAWHDHSAASRHAHGAAYATYVGTWKSRFRFLGGEDELTRYEDGGRTRSFCRTCGTPVLYERGAGSKVVNIPRALFATRTGRETRYHMNQGEMADWTWLGEPLGPLKGYPGVLIERKRKSKRAAPKDPMFE